MKRTLKVNNKLLPFLTKPQPIKAAVGGRGSGKSLGIGDMATFKMENEGSDIYCLREFQDSLTDSVHKVFVGSINERLNLEGWDIQANTVIAPNGSRTTYKGAHRNPDAMQSAQGYKYSWFEEAHRASQDSLDKLLPTIIRNPGAQCWFSANPQSSADPFSQRFIVPYQKELLRDGYYEDDLHYIVVVNWRDNPWWNAEQEQLRAWDYKHLSRAKYDWIWEGAFNDTVDNAIIHTEWFDACIDAHLKLGFEARGAKIVSFDPSDLGPDPKGLCYRHGSVILDVQERTYGDANDGADWATNYAIGVQADCFIWDCDGLGVSLRKQILESIAGKKMDHRMFKGSEGVDDPGQIYQSTDKASNVEAKSNSQSFKNKRAQYYIRLADRMYNTYRAVVKGEYVDPEEMISFSSNIQNMTGFRAEICRIPKKETGNGINQILSKVEMARLKPPIKSPNMADSIMMNLAYRDTNAGILEMNFATAHG